MKCEHCGKNEATFYYKSNINGQVTEQHLCSDCARALGYADGFGSGFSGLNSFFGGMDDLFAPVPAMAGSFFAPFERAFGSFGGMFPQLSGSCCTAPAAASAAVPASAPSDGLVSEDEHKKLDRERRVNALRYEMQQAIQSENFERAAQLRDQIHSLEQQG